MGSGKGTAARFLSKKYGYKIINMGNIVRALARRNGVKPTRSNLEKLQVKYRGKYGRDFVIGKAIEKALASKKPVILDGIRKPVQAKLAKKVLKAKIILVDARPEVRFQRLKNRRRKSGYEKTFDDFKKMEKQERKFFKMDKTFKYADYKLDNSKDARHLERQLRALIKKLK